MADGSYTAIDKVRADDRVLAANPVTGVWTSRPVLDQWSHLDDGRMATATLTDGSSVTATDHHEFWVASNGAWVELDDVRPGDFLLTPDGVTAVAALQVGGRQNSLVWELDVAVDDTFAVHTGTNDVLVHNGDCRPGDLTADDLTHPDFKVPGTADFNAWFDPLDPEAFREAFENDPKFRDAIKDRIRYPGGRHGCCLCSRAPTFQEWDVPMEQIKEFTTETKQTTWTNPVTGVEGRHKAPGVDAVESNAFHSALQEVVDGSTSIDDFNRRTQQFWDDWEVPPDVRPDNFPSGGG